MFLLEFFRDFLDGIVYYLYLILCIFALFYVLGIVADRKREMIEKKLKEKKQYDIASGREAEIAARETKQILAVEETPEEQNSGLQIQGAPVGGLGTQLQENNQKEEVPAVMVLDSSTMNNPAPNQGQQAPMQQMQPMQPMVGPLGQGGAQAAPQQQAAQPLILNSK